MTDRKKSLGRVLIFFLFLCVNRGFATVRGDQELITAGSPVYDKATAVFLESGLWNFADSVPVTIEELKFYLSEVDYDSLSESGRTSYDSIQSYFGEENISFDSDIFNIGFEPSLSLEGYYKNNDDIAWVFDKYSRKPLVDLPLTLNASKYFTIMCDLYLWQNRCQMLKKDNYVNVPLSSNQFNLNFPTTAYFSTGTKVTDGFGVSFQTGLAETSVGRTLSGSVIRSEYMTGATYAQLSAYSHKIKYSASITQLNTERYFYMHKLEARPHKSLTISAIEGQLCAKPMELRFMNPLTIFHGFAPWNDYSEDDDMYTSAFMGLKLSWVPVKYLRFYGLFAMTQYQTPYEKSSWGDSLTPNGLGGQAGLESYIPAKGGYFHWGIEGYYAQPYLYLKPSPNSSMVRTYTESIGEQDPIYEWIGSPFGPDSIAGTAVAGYEVPEKWSVTAKYLFLVQGELADDSIFRNAGWMDETLDWYALQNPYSDTANNWKGYPHTAKERDQTTPTGTPQYNHRISVKMTLNPTNWMELVAQPSYVIIFNNGHIKHEKDHGFEIAAGCRIKFCKIK